MSGSDTRVLFLRCVMPRCFRLEYLVLPSHRYQDTSQFSRQFHDRFHVLHSLGFHVVLVPFPEGRVVLDQVEHGEKELKGGQ